MYLQTWCLVTTILVCCLSEKKLTIYLVNNLAKYSSGKPETLFTTYMSKRFIMEVHLARLNREKESFVLRAHKRHCLFD